MRPEQMRQPQVEYLSYRVHLHRDFRLDNPPPVVVDIDGFTGRLHGDALELRPKVAFPTEAQARAGIEPLLHAWEICAALDAGGPVMHFEFANIRLLDAADPAAPGYGRNSGTVSLAGLLVKQLTSYPSPPTDFVVTPDVESLWVRYRMYCEGREPLQPMAYFCFTVLTARAGGRSAAAKTLRIDDKVLRTLSALSTNTGDATTARKRTGQLRAPTAAERRWLVAVVPAIIGHLGRLAVNASLSQLQMADLPLL